VSPSRPRRITRVRSTPVLASRCAPFKSALGLSKQGGFGAADILNVYVSEAGGLRNAMRIFELAQSAGLWCTIGSMPELGIGTAAAAHLAAAAPMLLDPSDVCGALYNAESLVQETFDIADGCIRPPRAASLGVTLDEARLEALTTGG
jgi:L-alanine-DL-glutamate epimerase-like enolase superfamily enzyme